MVHKEWFRYGTLKNNKLIIFLKVRIKYYLLGQKMHIVEE